jgi:uncharacterized protein YndB with AHSA1/START domain
MNELDELIATRRTVGEHDVRLRRTYDTSIEDLWEAITVPERIRRWFLPITGDLRVGGSYQLEGNAGGEILRCEPPELLLVTWNYGDDTTEVTVRLSTSDDGATRFELTHTGVGNAKNWAEFGPGAVGVGWDSALLGLAWHLKAGASRPPDPMAWMGSPEGKGFMTASSNLWGEAMLDTGADEAMVAEMVANTTKAYAGWDRTVGNS